MRANKARFITICQQLLVLGFVLAALTPAASVINLDVVAGATPKQSDQPLLTFSAYRAVEQKPAFVDTAPVDPSVREVSLTADANPAARVARPTTAASVASADGGGQQLLSTPQKVHGFGAIGVTWTAAQADVDLGVQARTKKKDGSWSGWTDVFSDPDHGPDPGSPEAKGARPGTDALLIGRVAKVQIKASGKQIPADLRLAIVNPGADRAATRQRAAIDTATLSPQAQTAAKDTAAATSEQGAEQQTAETAAKVPAAAPSLIAPTPAPTIYSRAQWGADDSKRTASTPNYYEVHAGFVHHTVNANDYTEADVPAIIRGIYAYHTKSRGWSDIGYNFLVDKFGRIWEGRYGGVDRPVVGAHTLGYNEYSFAMSAIGNYDIAQPSAAVIQAYGALFAWKLSLHGVSAASPSQAVGKSTFQAINGHRDAGKTACPGRYLYAQLPAIRQYAAAGQVGWAGRQKQSNLVGDANPDLVVRRKADGQMLVIPTAGTAGGIGAPIDTGRNIAGYKTLLNVGDWDRDGYGDVMLRDGAGTLLLLRGDGTGHFADPITVGALPNVRLLAAVGDMTGDGFPDLMGQPKQGSMTIYPGAGMSGFYPAYAAYGKVKGGRQVGFGLLDGDGAPDSLIKRGKYLQLLRGNGPGGLSGDAVKLKKGMKRFDWLIGTGDMDMNGTADLLLRNRKKGTLYVMPAVNGRLTGRQQIGSGLDAYDLAD